MENELRQNFAKIIKCLEDQDMKPTNIAHVIGFTTTTQLYNTIEGKSTLSTKAIIGLIQNLKVNPSFLFLGKGEMFEASETEVEALRQENFRLVEKVNGQRDTLHELEKKIIKLEKKNDNLVELFSAAIKHDKGQDDTDENNTEDLKDEESPWENLPIYNNLRMKEIRVSMPKEHGSAKPNKKK